MSTFSALKCFIEYFADRGLLPEMMLAAPPKPKTYRAPFIYTRAQVKALLAATTRCQLRGVDLTADTLRMVVLLLYATGATVDEVLSLRSLDVDLQRRRISLSATGCRRGRVLPISIELRDLLGVHLRSQRNTSQGLMLLLSAGGQPLSRRNLCVRFNLLLTLAGVSVGAQGQKPRMQDFRCTFAVHRLKSWIGSGADLNAMLPALSAYMGYASLTKAEEFLAFTPERFRSDLQKLAIGKRRPKWCSNEALMAFLSQL